MQKVLDRMLLIVRNPFDALVAEYSRRNGHSHTRAVSSSLFGIFFLHYLSPINTGVPTQIQPEIASGQCECHTPIQTMQWWIQEGFNFNRAHFEKYYNESADFMSMPSEVCT